MGAATYFYFCEYQDDVAAALEDLRQREFKAGRYQPALFEAGIASIEFPPDVNSASPGAKHSSIEEAFSAGGTEGTSSILDIQHISKTPVLMGSSPLQAEFLIRFFGTEQPTRDLVERVLIREEPLDEDDDDSLEAWDDFADSVHTPGGCHFTVYQDGKPSEIFFTGYVNS